MALFQPSSPWKVLGCSAVAVPLTGSTSETALATVTIPAGAIGANGLLRVTLLTSHTNNANTKTIRVRLGGIGGTAFISVANTATLSMFFDRTIANRNSQSAQVAAAASSINAYSASGSAPTTGTVDTSASQDLVISGQLQAGADTMTLESYLVELAYRP